MTPPDQVWRAFCARLADSGDLLLARPDAIDQAEGLRYLTRLLRIGLEMNLEAADPHFPYFYQASHETAKIGADNPDNIYWNATISPDCRYRVTGNRGTMKYFSIGTKANRYHIDGTMASTGERDDATLTWGEDGAIDMIVSQAPHDGNWLPMQADSSFVVIRQTFFDRAREIPGRFRIICLDAPPAPAPLAPDQVARALTRTTQFVQGTATTFLAWMQAFADQPNQLVARDQTQYWRAGGDPNIVYFHSYYDFPADHAWVIQFTPPPCRYWNFQLNNGWMESLDYRYLPISVNQHGARYNQDGSVTLIIADSDPGVGNFLDRAHHRSGTALLRYLGADTAPVPHCAVIPVSQLLA